MGIFDKLLSTRAGRETRRTIRGTEAAVAEVYGPLGKLAQALTVAADSTQQQLLPALGVRPGATPSEPQILTLYELFYFFLHVTVRVAVGRQFNSSQTGKLQAFLGPLLASTATDAYFRHWPEDKKRGIQSDFFTKLNDAEMEYAACRMIPGENALDEASIFGRLARNIASLWDREDDFAIRATVLTSSTEAFLAMKLEEHLASVLSVIDRFSLDEINDYWSRGA